MWGQIVKNIYTYFQGLYLCLRNWVKYLFFLWKLFFFPWPHTALSLLSCEEMSKVFFFIRTFFLSHKEKKIQVEFFFCFCVRNHMIFFFSWGKPFFSVCGEKIFQKDFFLISVLGTKYFVRIFFFACEKSNELSKKIFFFFMRDKVKVFFS